MGHREAEGNYKELAPVSVIEEKLGVPVGFVRSLIKEGSDWEFAVKLSVLVEAALGKVVAAHLHNDAVARHVERLNLNGNTGKVSLARDLGILTNSEAKGLLALAGIRNAFAHQVENISGDLSKFGESMPEAARRNLIRDFLMLPDEDMNGLKFLWGDSFPRLLRGLMWSFGKGLLEVLATQDEHATRERRRRLEVEEVARQGEKSFTLDKLFSDFDSIEGSTPPSGATYSPPT